MRVIVAITIFEDDGTELDSALAVAETVDDAFERAREELELEP
jgi:hypothetical protein